MNQDLQESFNLAFPKHVGHFIKAVNPYTDLTAPFTCSCGEVIRVNMVQMFAAAKDDRKLIMDHLTVLHEARSLTYTYLSGEAMKIGFVLYPIDDLVKQMTEPKGDTK